MARLFLDSNFVIETIGFRQSEAISETLKSHKVYISPLTIHIICYIFKRKIPDPVVSNFANQVNLVGLSPQLTELALSGPTADFEDNVQLHSASVCNADYFLTHDQDLLEMKFFGKTRILDQIS